jgi:hypothetical protein
MSDPGRVQTNALYSLVAGPPGHDCGFSRSEGGRSGVGQPNRDQGVVRDAHAYRALKRPLIIASDQRQPTGQSFEARSSHRTSCEAVAPARTFPAITCELARHPFT